MYMSAPFIHKYKIQDLFDMTYCQLFIVLVAELKTANNDRIRVIMQETFAERRCWLEAEGGPTIKSVLETFMPFWRLPAEVHHVHACTLFLSPIIISQGL